MQPNYPLTHRWKAKNDWLRSWVIDLVIANTGLFLLAPMAAKTHWPSKLGALEILQELSWGFSWTEKDGNTFMLQVATKRKQQHWAGRRETREYFSCWKKFCFCLFFLWWNRVGRQWAVDFTGQFWILFESFDLLNITDKRNINHWAMDTNKRFMTASETHRFAYRVSKSELVLNYYGFHYWKTELCRIKQI